MKLEAWLQRLEEARLLEGAGRVDCCLEALRLAPGTAVVRALGQLRRLGHDAFAEAALDAFPRLGADGRRLDPGCAGRVAIAEALLALDWSLPEPWRTGIALVQWEPVFGGKVDSAAGLRGLCALGLVRAEDPGAPLALARLLADPQSEARRGAIRALREAPESWALPLLAHRALLRTEDLDAQLDLFHGLLEREQDEAFSLVAGFLLDDWAEGREAAAIALGERGGPAGARLLWRCLDEEPLRERRRPLWLGLALARGDEGRGELLARLRTAGRELKREVDSALDGVLDDELRACLAGSPARKGAPRSC